MGVYYTSKLARSRSLMIIPKIPFFFSLTSFPRLISVSFRFDFDPKHAWHFRFAQLNRHFLSFPRIAFTLIAFSIHCPTYEFIECMKTYENMTWHTFQCVTSPNRIRHACHCSHCAATNRPCARRAEGEKKLSRSRRRPINEIYEKKNEKKKPDGLFDAVASVEKWSAHQCKMLTKLENWLQIRLGN